MLTTALTVNTEVVLSNDNKSHDDGFDPENLTTHDTTRFSPRIVISNDSLHETRASVSDV